MGLPIDTQCCCHGCEYYNDGYCRLHKENVEEQDWCDFWRGKEFTFDYGNDD
jgi:hypothetical protein